MTNFSATGYLMSLVPQRTSSASQSGQQRSKVCACAPEGLIGITDRAAPGKGVCLCPRGPHRHHRPGSTGQRCVLVPQRASSASQTGQHRAKVCACAPEGLIGITDRAAPGKGVCLCPRGPHRHHRPGSTGQRCVLVPQRASSASQTGQHRAKVCACAPEGLIGITDRAAPGKGVCPRVNMLCERHERQSGDTKD